MAATPTVVWMPGAVRTEVHLRGEDTDGAFCLLVDELPQGWSLPEHRHRDEAETMHVIAGELAVVVAGRAQTLCAGETLHVPLGVLHAGHNRSDGPVRRVVVFSPAGMERFFLEAGAATPEAVDARGALDAALRHGWEFPRASR